MKRNKYAFTLILVLAFVALFGTATYLQAGTVVDPGTKTEFVGAEGAYEEVSVCTGNNHCVADWLGNQTGVATILVEGEAQTVRAKITAYHSFTLSEGGGSNVNALLNGLINWEGYLNVGPENAARAAIAIMVELFDVTDNKAIALQTIHNDSCSAMAEEPCYAHDTGSGGINLAVALTRGHSYEIRIAAECMSEFAEATNVICAYIENDASYGVDFGNGFVTWSNLMLSVEPDFGEAIIDLREDLDALTLEVQQLILDFDQLRAEFDNHTHVYLTGKGVGHNNTEAITTPPVSDPAEQPGDGSTGSDNSNGNGNGKDKDKNKRGKDKR